MEKRLTKKLDDRLKNFEGGELEILGYRRKKLINRVAEAGYNKDEVRETIEIIASLSEGQLDELLDDDGATMLEKVIGKAFKRAVSMNSYKYIKDIMEVFIGKPTASTEVTHEHRVNVPSISWGGKTVDVEGEVIDE